MNPELLANKLKYEGRKSISVDGYEFTILKYVSYKHVEIQFTGSETIQIVRKSTIDKECVKRVMSNKERYQNQIRENKKGELYEVKNYKNDEEIEIEFENGVKKTITLRQLKSNNITSYIAHQYQVGERKQNKRGLWYTILDPSNSQSIIIKFDEDDETRTVNKTQIDRNQLSSIKEKNSYIEKYKVGKKYTSKDKKEFEIIENNGSRNIKILFEDGKEMIVSNEAIDKNKVVHTVSRKNNIEGHPADYPINIKHPYYSLYKGMVRRCTEGSKHYRNSNLCTEWQTFAGFMNWFLDVYYEIDEELHVDKDILSGDARIYSPQTCLLIPARLNVKFKNIRETNLLEELESGEYKIRFNDEEKNKSMVLIDKDKNKLIDLCLKTKINNFKLSVKEYKGKIPEDIYNILYNFNNIDIDYNELGKIVTEKQDKIVKIKKETLDGKYTRIKNEYEGKIYETKKSGLAKIIKYNGSRETTIEFLNTGYITTIRLSQLESGDVKDPYAKNICGVACLGVGKYAAKDYGKVYSTWSKTIRFIYTDNNGLKNIPLGFCDEWLNFQNFAKWYEENYYEIEGEEVYLSFALATNKFASKDTIAFIPEKFRILFASGSKTKKNDLPRGVYKSKGKNKYSAKITFNGITYNLGFDYDTPYSASFDHDQKREELYKELVESYKNKIPEKVYNLLMSLDINSF